MTLEAKRDTTLLVLSGQPIHEPVARYGPFVEYARRNHSGGATITRRERWDICHERDGAHRRCTRTWSVLGATSGSGDWEQALESVQAQERARVFWRPFQLNPTMPATGMDRRVPRDEVRRPGEVQAIHDRITVAGVSAGIEFAFGRITRTPNTFDAHRLVWFAQQQGRQDAVVEALFHGYFTDGVNVGEADALISLAAGAGLDAAAVGRFLQTKDGVDAVRQEEARGRQLGIRGVPYFVLNGKTVVSGAQPVETFVRGDRSSEGVRRDHDGGTGLRM